MRDMPLHCILTPVGSAGDVHPFVGIGIRLRQRGHQVTIITSEPFRDLCERLDLNFVAIGSAEEFESTIRYPHLWHPRRGLRYILRTMSRHLEQQYDTIASLCEAAGGKNTVLVGHALSFGTRVFEDRTGMPAVTVQLSPTVFRSDFGQPSLAPGLNFSRFPRWFKRSLWTLIDRHYVDPYIVPVLNRCRATHGLAPVARPFKKWVHSPQGVIGLFPDWFAPPQPDWPKPLHLAGFALFDENQLYEPNSELERFLDESDPPIAFTPGSANAQAPRFFRAAIEATLLLKRRALFLTRFPEQLPPSLPAGVMHVSYAPFSRVLPRCAALVHHGGIGTCAQGIAAGVPQLLMPMGFDQPDNAARLKVLGVGSWIAPHRFSGRRVARALRKILESPTTAAATRQCAVRLKETDAVDRACEVIEAVGFHTTARSPRPARPTPASAA